MSLIRFIVVFISLNSFNSIGAIIVSNGTGGGNWITGTTWAGGVAPTAADDVVIVPGDIVTLANNRACINFTNNGTLNFTTNTITLTVNGNLTTTGAGVVIGGGTNRIMNVLGTITVPTTNSLNIQGITLTVTGLATIDGTLLFSANAAGTKTFSNDLIVNNTASIVFDIVEGLNVTGNLIANGTCSLIGGAANGSITVGGTTTISAGANATLANGTLATTGVGIINGTLTITNAAGNKNFTNDLSINNGGAVNFTATETLQIAGNLTMNGTSTISGSATGIVNVSNNATVSAGAAVAWGRATWTVNGLMTFSGAVTTTNANGNFNFNGITAFNNGGAIIFNSVKTVACGATLNMNPGSAIGNGTAIGIVTVAGIINVNTGGTSVMNSINLTAGSDINILGTGVLDAGVGNLDVDLFGNWNNTSTAGDPFVETGSLINFISTTITQNIIATGGTETFDAISINNTSGLNPAITFGPNIVVVGEIDLLAGIVDMQGKNLTVLSAVTVATTCTMSGGQLLSTIAGSNISFTDGAGDFLIVDFTNTDVGSAAFAIPLTINTGRICIEDMELYGVGNFTKTLNTDDVCTGGNIFHNNVTFTVSASGSRWRMGDGGTAQPDIYLANATFIGNATSGTNNNFIIGANSIGNEYFGTTTFTSTTLGGFYIGRSNGTGNNSHTFHGPVVINVALDGNVVLGDAAAANVSTIVLENTIQLNSTITSIGDIYIGSATGFSTITFNVNGRIIDGTISGATNIYFNSITQNNALANNTTSAAATASTIYVGNALLANACLFNGNVTFVSPNISLRGSTFNGTNSFQANGVTNFTSYGGNTFNGTTTFINNGTGYWRLANNATEDFNANATFNQLSTGALAPAYNFDCFFSGNVTALTNTMTFGAGTGRIILDGTTNQFLNGVATIWNRGRINKASGTTTQNNVTITTILNMDFLSGVYTIPSPNMMIFNDNATATNESALSFVDGVVRKIGNDAFDFPVGDNNLFAPISISAPTGTAHFFTAQYFNSNPDLVPYDITSKDVSLTNISTCEYWILDRNSAPTSNVSVTLSWDTRSCGIVDISQLAVARWDGTQWKDHGNGGTTGTPALGTIITSAPVTSFSPFTLASYSLINPLPIELISFEAVPSSSTVLLSWITASETNNDYFEVEKSIDGINWSVIAKVDGAGNSSDALNYEIEDKNPFLGTTYYRLKQTDFDGAHEYSESRKVEFLGDNEVVVYPNPSVGNFVIAGIDDESAQIFIYNAVGQKLNCSYDYQNGLMVIAANDLPTGNYFVSIVNNGEIVTRIILIEN